MKTIEAIINEIKASEELQKKLAEAAKNNAVEAFLKEQGCEATAEEFINALKPQEGELGDDELGAVGRVLEVAVPKLNKGGRLAIITFHSLEDRLVKNGMAANAKGCTCPPSFPVCVCGNKPRVKLISKKPIVSGEEELERNPRARSAKLRVCEKL